MQWKRILLILGFIAVSVGIGYALYFLFFRAAPQPPTPNANVSINASVNGLPNAGTGAPTPSVNAVPGQLPPVSPVAVGGLTQVTEITLSNAQNPSLASDGTLSYYNPADGKFYRIGPDGIPVALSNKKFFNIDKATFDRLGTKAVIEYPDGANVAYNFATDSQVTLPKQWEAFDFSADSNQIVAKSIGSDESNRFLITANADGTNAKAVQELGANADQVQVAWSPNNQVVATATTGDYQGADSQQVFLIGKNQENFKSITVSGIDFRPNWSPDGERLLYSAAGSINNYQPRLWIVDAAGDRIGSNRKNLNINTWADKCTFSDTQTLYCAVPTSLPNGAGLQPTIADQTPDDVYRIDLSTGLQTKIAIPVGAPTIAKIMISPDKGTLYYSDKNTGTLNKIKLR